MFLFNRTDLELLNGDGYLILLNKRSKILVTVSTLRTMISYRGRGVEWERGCMQRNDFAQN